MLAYTLRISLTINKFGLVAVNGANGKLAVGGLGSTITAGKVVNNETEDLTARNTLESGLDAANVLNGITGILLESHQP